MAKERALHLTGEIKLPDDQFDAADIMSKARGIVRQAEADLSEAVGHDFKFTATTTKPRRERASNSAPRTRKSRTSAASE